MTGIVEKRLQESGYSNSYKKGIEAIENKHRSTIRVTNTRNLKGSMDIDKACKTEEPHSPRWDYLVVVKKNNLENLALIEVHGAAKPGNVGEMIAKKEWVLKWIRKTGLKDLKKTFIWIATGSNCLTKQSPYTKRLALSGIPRPVKVTPYLDTEVDYN